MSTKDLQQNRHVYTLLRKLRHFYQTNCDWQYFYTSKFSTKISWPMLGTPYALYLLNVHAPLEVIETVTVRIEVQCKNGKKKDE